MSSLRPTYLILTLLLSTCISLNTYTITHEPTGEIVWRSTTPFYPQTAASYGEIRIGQEMSIEFDFVYEGRTSTWLNQFFRIGAASDDCAGQDSKYPSMWLKYGANMNTAILDIQFTGDTAPCNKHYLADYGNLIKNVSHHILISLNETNASIQITGGEKAPLTTSWPRSPTPLDVLGDDVSVWWSSDGEDPALGTFSNIVITTDLYTLPPTTAPTAPSTNPTTTPSQSPSSSPTSPSRPPSSSPSRHPSKSPSSSPTTSTPTQTPTGDTLTPSAIPTTTPSQSPTGPPSSAPSHVPSQPPSSASQTPSKSPTESTSNPSTKPTRGPTTHPSGDLAAKGTTYQTNDPTLSHSQEMEDILHLQQERRNSLEITFQYFIYIILGFVLLIALSGYFHSRFLSANDFFQVRYVIVAGIQMFDTLSDCCFAINLSTYIDNERQINTQFRLPLILSVVSIIVPICISIVQLFLYLQKHWNADCRLTGWLAVNTKYLYTLSFLTGSSFTAVSLLNSELFGLGLFCMGLSERDVLTFSIKRVYSVVAAENLPQAVIQTWYIFEGTNSNYIAITSLIFSFMSIIVALLSFVGQKRIIDAQSYIEIKMDVIGKFNRQKCKGIVEGLKAYFCFDVFVVDKNLIEVLKPLFIKKGLQLTIRIYLDDKNDKSDTQSQTYYALIDDVRSNGELAQQIRHCWNIQNVPNIENIKVETIESKNIRHNARDANDSVRLQMIPPQI